jgi:hypothetical protein
LLDLVFTSSAHFLNDLAENGTVQPAHFHPPFISDFTIQIRCSKQNYSVSLKTYSATDLCTSILHTAYDCSSLHNETSADAATG